MEHFSDRIQHAIKTKRSILVAGIDPDLESIPAVFRPVGEQASCTTEDYLRLSITQFYLPMLKEIQHKVAAVKPNLAFFEQYGIGGMRAYVEICQWCRNNNLLVIADAKRGDIGSTALAYARAYFGPHSVRGQTIDDFSVDALTISPFLGFDTLEPFIKLAKEKRCGLFILARTSNPGSGNIQGITDSTTNISISSTIARWINTHSQELLGTSGISGLGAVVGATQKEEIARMRKEMPHALFLVPGFGAQGGDVNDIISARSPYGSGVIVNSSRGIFGTLPPDASIEQSKALIIQRIEQSNEILERVHI